MILEGEDEAVANQPTSQPANQPVVPGPKKSVFDYLKPADRARIMAGNKRPPPPPGPGPPPGPPPSGTAASRSSFFSFFPLHRFRCIFKLHPTPTRAVSLLDADWMLIGC